MKVKVSKEELIEVSKDWGTDFACWFRHLPDFIILEGELVNETLEINIPKGTTYQLHNVPASVEEPATAGECCPKCPKLKFLDGGNYCEVFCPCHRSQAEKGECKRTEPHICNSYHPVPKELPVPEPFELSMEEGWYNDPIKVAIQQLKNSHNEILTYLRATRPKS